MKLEVYVIKADVGLCGKWKGKHFEEDGDIMQGYVTSTDLC